MAHTGPPAGGRRSRWCLAQHVSDPPHGVDQPRLVCGLGLSAEVADVDLERVGGSREVESPDLVEEPAALQYAAGMSQKRFEQRELGPGEVDRPGPTKHLAGVRVQDQIGELEVSG